MRTQRRLRITVLAGGPSAEREVSLASGAAVAAALRRRGHDVLVADITPDDLSALDRSADVVFPALHGTFGEDGTLQRILEARGIRFMGSNSRSSALAMNKVEAKHAVLAEGIATPPFEVWTAADLDKPAPALALPVVVKPVGEGSSVSTYIIRAAATFPAAVRDVVEKHAQALVEQFITGDEITVGIVGDQVLPPICVRPKREFYDYQAKYHDDGTEYLFDAGHPPELLERAQRLSRRAFERLDCRHLARVDWIVDRDGGLWFLEVNTIPGFTSHSLVPMAAAHVGIPFDELCDRLVRMAVGEES